MKNLRIRQQMRRQSQTLPVLYRKALLYTDYEVGGDCSRDLEFGEETNIIIYSHPSVEIIYIRKSYTR